MLQCCVAFNFSSGQLFSLLFNNMQWTRWQRRKPSRVEAEWRRAETSSKSVSKVSNVCDLHVSPLPLISPPSPTPSTLATASSNLLCSFRSRGKLKVIEALHEEKGKMVKVSTSTAMGWIKIGGLTATRFDFTFSFFFDVLDEHDKTRCALALDFITFKGGKRENTAVNFTCYVLITIIIWWLSSQYSAQ